MEQTNAVIRIALVDDHALMRNALAKLINSFENLTVILEASNGWELTELLNANDLPDVLVLDLNMPLMDGFETADWLHNNHPSVRILMLTMYDGEQALIRLLQYGVKGFLKKDAQPSELHFAIRSVMGSGFYYSQDITGRMANLFRMSNDNTMALEKGLLTTQEITFLKLSTSDMTYKEIALQMNLTARAVDTMRDNLFEKLEIKSRVGLVMYAIRQAIVTF